ncbi:MAG TPA: glycosyltransferase, partial [Usitatibacter sp.]
QTRACVESVLSARCETPVEVVVVDDASPEPGICEYLRELSRAGRITLLANDANLGFIQSVNRGMTLHEERDVILLNSDTEVAGDWVDRLRAAAYAAPRVATVTPFSNNATICSYPFEGWKGGVPGALGLAALDRLFASANAGRRIDLPTAVGFCMLIRRDCLREIGLFDAERFGRGYGEENDFCMRASKAGWRNLLAADVFVFHEGSVSFSEERFALIKAAAPALFAVHPDYPLRVHEFIEADEASALRAAVDRARAATDDEESRSVVEERLQERSIIVKELHTLLRKSWDYEDHLARLRAELAQAATVMASQLIAERDAEIARLRAGLSHAESLAFSRQKELDQIHSFWLWRYWNYLLRRKRRDAT